ncbi:MAG: sigma-54 dependent transcriptional regulator [Candidatus Omnitrophica bacterium]|nr:sigma-54 dependent transcriptional regulator [Candidatus Omnitrophota bacterium]MDD5670903.1 sigma-54 dependent transcriptional regulator [Candidatus Omnitrophota bacterium]
MSLYATILVAEDEANAREGLVHFLEGLDYEVVPAVDGEEAWQEYLKSAPDLVLADIRMPSLDGIGLLEKIRHHNPNAKVILLTAYGSVEDAVKAMKKGAFYYLTKPVNLEELEFQVKKALANQDLEEENRELKQALFKEKFVQGEIVAKSSKMKELLKTVDKIAQSTAAVLIEGESGTGKELIAHRIHQLSSRANKPFVAVHCAALTETLLTSELFGHEKGAFTGATERSVGRFERAHDGTIFLDEIGEISRDTQVKLLRVLQDGQFERVGGTKPIKVDVRLLCATNKILIDEVKAGRFREDLYYRINVIYLKIPPLRERPEDIPPLVEYFIKHYAQANGKKITAINEDAMRALTEYAWPGNIREVKNIAERMVVLSSSPALTLHNVPEDIRSGSGVPDREGSSNAIAGASGRLSDMEKGMIVQTLESVKGNKSLAAKKLGISRRTLYRKIDDYKL